MFYRAPYRPRSLALAALCWLSVTFISAPGWGIGLDETLVLSGRSVDNRRPVVASSGDGVYTFVAWEGVVGGNRRILLREAIHGIWLPEIIVDSTPLAENQLPSVDVDAGGNPHIAWVARIEGHYVPQYTARVAGHWNTLPLEAGDGTSDCDYVNVKLDDHGSPWVVWQSARGSAYEVFCAYLNPTGSFQIEPLTPGSQSHNLFPELVFDPEPTVLWYTAREDGFFLVGERYVRATQQWDDAKLTDLDALPGEPLPRLVRRTAGPLAALWYEKPALAQDEALYDRVYLGQQDAASRGAGDTLDQPLDASNTQVAGAVAGNQIVAAWCSTSIEEGSQIYAAHGSSAGDSSLLKLSDGEDLYYSNPDITTGGHDAMVVWQSTLSVGGNGRIYFRHIRQVW